MIQGAIRADIEYQRRTWNRQRVQGTPTPAGYKCATKFYSRLSKPSYERWGCFGGIGCNACWFPMFFEKRGAQQLSPPGLASSPECWRGSRSPVLRCQ